MIFSNPTEALLVLGLTGDATPADVKNAYRRLLKIYHPDNRRDREIPRKYYEIEDAYGYLNDLFFHTGAKTGWDLMAMYAPQPPVSPGTGYPGFSPRPSGNVIHPQMASCDTPQVPRPTGRILGSAEEMERQAFRTRSKEDLHRKEQRSRIRRRREEEQRKEEEERRRRDALYEETMHQIHVERAAEVTAQLIRAILAGENKEGRNVYVKNSEGKNISLSDSPPGENPR